MASIYDLKVAPLLDEGLSEYEVARRTGIPIKLIRRGRQNGDVSRMRGVSAARSDAADERYRPLYDKGLTDDEIAKRTGSTPDAVGGWRNSRRLPLHADGRVEYRDRLKAEADARYMPHYERGLNDAQIAEATGVAQSTVERWRGNRGLRANSEKSARNYYLHYRRGLTDEQIAEKTGGDLDKIRVWRERRRLPENVGTT